MRHFAIVPTIFQAIPSRGWVDEAPEKNPSSPPYKGRYQRNLGETPEAVKPCLEDSERDMRVPGRHECRPGMY